MPPSKRFFGPLNTLALAAALNVAGCATSYELARESAIGRAQREFRCPRERVKTRYVETLDDLTVFKVNSCGHVVNYVCDGDEGCIREWGGR